ncbi:EthD domain-containing protein [Sphingobium faniae]|nr:EthD domain-containing protein [Sphingobium faniae]
MIKVVMFARRKPGISPEEFRDYYENKHVVLAAPYVKGVMIDHFRIYPGKVRAFAEDWTKADDMPEIEPPFDAVSVYSFESEKALEDYARFMADPEIAAIFTTDELRFLDRPNCLNGPCAVEQGPGVTNKAALSPEKPL